MSVKSVVVVSSRPQFESRIKEIEKESGVSLTFIQDHNELTPDRLGELKPEKIFFPHWSYMIPAEIYEKFDCVIFHMTDLPFGRGGSPLQNLIVRGMNETKISALKCEKELDAGPIYMKKPLSLQGKAEEIFNRAYDIIGSMIVELIKTNPDPQPQKGPVVIFKRRTKEDGDIKNLENSKNIYDHIRMLDAEGYPSAFIETDHFRYEFSNAALEGENVTAKVVIKKK